MFVDECSTKESLVRMVRRMTANVALREDLLQEALIHLWLTEARRPGQTKSWYLQSCKYHLLHYLASGRSIDSGKRRNGQMQPTLDLDHVDGFPEEGDSGNSVLTWVSARDIISLLAPQLVPQEIAVLHCFADGMGPREIGRKLKISHTMVIKHRRKIASLFNRLDLPASRARLAYLKRSQGAPHDRLNGSKLPPSIVAPAPVRTTNGNGNGHGQVHSNGHAHAANRHSTNGHANGQAHSHGTGHYRLNGNLLKPLKVTPSENPRPRSTTIAA